MFKLFFTLFRGKANELTESFTDRQALTILRQQINDCAKAVQAARKSVAIAMSQNNQEEEQYKQILSRISDLEERTMSALEKGDEKSAREGAETIAYLEAERDNSKAALHRYLSGITKLQSQVNTAETRLRELKRGYQLAQATDKTQKMRTTDELSGTSTLSEAEETLSRLQKRQQEIDYVTEAIEEMDDVANAQNVIERLAEKGHGSPLKSSTDSVLERLKQQSKAAETESN